jgi:hypothetical protein
MEYNDLIIIILLIALIMTILFKYDTFGVTNKLRSNSQTEQFLLNANRQNAFTNSDYHYPSRVTNQSIPDRYENQKNFGQIRQFDDYTKKYLHINQKNTLDLNDDYKSETPMYNDISVDKRKLKNISNKKTKSLRLIDKDESEYTVEKHSDKRYKHEKEYDDYDKNNKIKSILKKNKGVPNEMVDKIYNKKNIKSNNKKVIIDDYSEMDNIKSLNSMDNTLSDIISNIENEK